MLLEHFWWGSVFLINLPAMALLLVLGPFLLPESQGPGPGPLRPARASLLSLAAVLPVIYGLKEIAVGRAGTRGYVRSVAVGRGARAALFVQRQRTPPHP